jgi:hypothetical protein
MRILLTLLLLVASPSFAALNDTGQDQCYDGAALVACTEANTGDAATYPRQDGRFGRDAQAAAGELTKTGAGSAAFDFTRICMSGEAAGTGSCPENPAVGTNSDEWACTRDNQTGLVWSIATISSTDWTDATTTHPASYNTANRCGFDSDWRAPTRRELLSIVDHGEATSPLIDMDYFPNTVAGYYWISDEFAPSSTSAWLVGFIDGLTGANSKATTQNAHLVHGTPLSDGSFTDNGDGTMTDATTGLVWDKCSWVRPGTASATPAALLPPRMTGRRRSRRRSRQMRPVTAAVRTGGRRTAPSWSHWSTSRRRLAPPSTKRPSRTRRLAGTGPRPPMRPIRPTP